MKTSATISKNEAAAFVIAMIQQNTEFAKLLSECKSGEEMAKKSAIAFAMMATK